jgi:hypothetical protein
VDASFYIQNDALEGQTVTFSGTCLNNSLVSPYTSTVFIKEFDGSYNVINSTTATPVAGQPFSITLTTGAGAHIQYGFETVGPDANPATVSTLGNVVYQVQYPPMELSTPNSQAVVAGQSVSFVENVTGDGPFTYQWTLAGTNLVNNNHLSGATSSTLIISNSTTADAGTYAVNVTNSSNVYGSQSAQLTVIPFAQAQTNQLIDPSFESGVFTASSTAGWLNFGSSAILNSSDYYPFTITPVFVYDGVNCLETYAGGAGAYGGVYQDRPALPGQVYTASGWFLTPSADPITDANICFMEVQFRDAGGNLLEDYQSGQISTNSPLDTWINLTPNNLYDGNYAFVGTVSSIISPPGTASVRAQVTYHTVAGIGEVDVDAMSLRLRETAATAATASGNLNLSFPTLYAPTYNVLYKTNLTDAAWHMLTSVVGDGTVKTVSDPATTKSRFYIVNTQ